MDERVLPYWNPYQAYGTPLAANMQSQPFSPLSILLILHPSPKTYDWFVLTRLFVTGLFTYFYLRLFLSFLSSLSGAVAAMLGGYFVLYVTMPHISVEMMLPVALWSGERLIRKPSPGKLLTFALAAGASILGGMPESTALQFSFIAIYLLMRLCTDGTLRPQFFTRVLAVTAGFSIGTALSAVQLIPFLEYLRHSFDVHAGTHIGTSYDARPLSMVTYFCPLLFGPIFDRVLGSDQSGLRNYIGMIGFFLSLLAGTCVVRRGKRAFESIDAITIFCLLAVVFVVLKRFGSGVFAWVGALPVFNLIVFQKYDEPLLSISFAILCGIGIERLVRQQILPRRLVFLCITSFLMLSIAVFLSKTSLLNEIMDEHIDPSIPTWSLGCSVIAIFLLLAATAFRSHARTEKMYGYFPYVVAVLLTAELCLSFVVPIYYLFNPVVRDSANPFAGAPYIEYLKRYANFTYRVFSPDNSLYPNWASSFQLFDIRDLDAMYLPQYFGFIQTFLPQHRPFDRFTGIEGFDFNDPLQRRLLQLSSVKYLISERELLPTIVDKIFESVRGHLDPIGEKFVGLNSVIIDGEQHRILGEHPPYSRLPYEVDVHNTSEKLAFAYGLNPAAWRNACGDGVEFILEIKDQNGAISKVFSNYIDPKHNTAERKLMRGEADLGRYVGQTITILLTTTPGPKNDNCMDWAFWSDFDLVHSGSISPPLKKVYAKEVNIYEYKDVLPRAATFYSVALANGYTDTYSLLKEPNLNVFKTIVLNASGLKKDELGCAEKLRSTEVPMETPASITHYTSQALTAEVTAKQAGIFVLNDSNYKGWLAKVDGKPMRVMEVDGLFRGVFVPQGQHTIQFLYRSTAVAKGLIVSGLGFLVVIFIGLKMRHARGPRAN
ncbi:MAG TPA: YfhO family protein [Bryobacteraceae bacterium]|nr:YfhO family protein [Bryobacteraceae bacterium]